jgi:hypothetical protein
MFLRNIGWLSTDYMALCPIITAMSTSKPTNAFQFGGSTARLQISIQLWPSGLHVTRIEWGLDEWWKVVRKWECSPNTATTWLWRGNNRQNATKPFLCSAPCQICPAKTGNPPINSRWVGLHRPGLEINLYAYCVCVLFSTTSQAIFPSYNLLLRDKICHLGKL